MRTGTGPLPVNRPEHHKEDSKITLKMFQLQKKHVESLSVFQWVLTYIFLGSFCAVVLFCLMFTSLWIVPVLYYLWVLIDRDTPERGGRRYQWMRNWVVWKHVRNYFPAKMIKTAELRPDRNYVFGCHPHGIICAGPFCCFATESTNFSQVFPGIRSYLAVLAGLFRLPVYREYMMAAGMSPVNKVSLDYLLSKNGTGNAVVIVIGGAAESMTNTPGEETIVLKNRKGFVRLALEHGADLVPVYTFGENDIFDQVKLEEGSWGRNLQQTFQKHVGFAPILLKGRGVLYTESWGLNPFQRPVTTVVGKPIRVPHIPVPSSHEVDLYHRLYMEGLTDLFQQHKTQCGLAPDHQLHII